MSEKEFNVGKATELYIRLRDRIAERKAAYEKDNAPDKAALEKLEGKILEFFNATGQESSRCGSGTAYIITQTSATVADWDSTLEFIQRNDRWDMLEHRVSKKAVEEYLEQNSDVPPGVNVTRRQTIGVQRARKS